jgi:hypothetical protein
MCGDTLSYCNLPICIKTGYWKLLLGDRTPTYPLFLSLFSGGFAFSKMTYIVIWQFLMGISTSLLVYWITLRITGNILPSIAAGLLNAISINLAVMEVMILSETITCLLIVSTAAMTLLIMTSERADCTLSWIALGVLTSLTILARPNNIFLIPLLLLILIVIPPASTNKPRFRKLAFFSMAAIIPIMLWCSFLHFKTGYFGLSTAGGVHFTHKTIDFVELAPDDFAPYRQVLSKWTTDRVGNIKHLDSRIWFALEELMSLQTLKEQDNIQRFIELSRELTKMNNALIAAHPFLYMKAVYDSFWRFWQPQPFLPVNISEITDPQSPSKGNVVLRTNIQQMLTAYAKYMDRFIQLAYYLFAISVGITVVVAAIKRDLISRWYILFIITLIMLSAIICAAVEYGNGRFPLPYQPLILTVVAIVYWEISIFISGRRKS